MRHVSVFDPQWLELALQARHGVVSANVSLRAKDQRFVDEPVKRVLEAGGRQAWTSRMVQLRMSLGARLCRLLLPPKAEKGCQRHWPGKTCGAEQIFNVSTDLRGGHVRIATPNRSKPRGQYKKCAVG